MKHLIKSIPILLILAIFSCSISTKAQNDSSRYVKIHDHGSLTDAWAVFQGMKMNFIRDNLELTSEEAIGFWPIFHEYEREKKEIMSNIIDGGPGKGPHFIDKHSDEQVDSMISRKLVEEQELIILKIEYYEKMKEVLPVKKVAHYYKLDDDFRRRLVERMRGKRGDGKGRER